MTNKEKAIIQAWIDDTGLYTEQMRDLCKEMKYMYVSRDGGDLQASMLEMYKSLQSTQDEALQRNALIIWTTYHQAETEVTVREKLKSLLESMG